MQQGRVIATGNLAGLMVSTLCCNARGVCSNPALGVIFPIVWCRDENLVQALC